MRMFEQLGLTEAQKTKLKTLTDKQREESAALRKKHNEQIDAILTPEQRKKLEEARKQMMERFRGMGGPGGPGGGPGSPGGPGGKPGGKKG
jgi:Spy/CpxP family protein refolding chaperone